MKRGLNIYGKLFRQLRIGNYGIADIVEVCRYSPKFVNDENGNRVIVQSGSLFITVYELKKEKIGVSSFLQAIRYAKGIQRYLYGRDFYDFSISICLIGKTIDISSSYIYLSDMIFGDGSEGAYDFLENYTYSYDLDGLKFKQESGYKLIDEGF